MISYYCPGLGVINFEINKIWVQNPNVVMIYSMGFKTKITLYTKCDTILKERPLRETKVPSDSKPKGGNVSNIS